VHRHIKIVTFVHPLLMGQHSLDSDCLVATCGHAVVHAFA